MKRNVIIDIFDEYKKIKNNTEISIDEMLSDIEVYKDRIILYGAGSAGIAFLHYLREIGIEPVCFADGNSKKWGTECEGLNVIDYHDIPEIYGADSLVIVTINTDGKKYCKSFEEELRVGGHSGVHKKLSDAGCKNIIDYTYFRRVRKLFCGDRYNLPSCSDVYCMEQHIEEIAIVYDWLSDDISKEVFENIVRYRLLDDTIQIRTESQEKQYFEYAFFNKTCDDVFVDCGAYNGTSFKSFLKENDCQFARYYGIEPDHNSFKLLSNYISELPRDIQEKVTLIEAAAYNHCRGTKLYQLNGPGSFISKNGMVSVSTVQLDDVLDVDKITYIKMNIEGSELKALKGAKKTIILHNPKLAIAGYHKTWDLWEIPKLIKMYNSGYKIYLRSYMNHISFVYYVV